MSPALRLTGASVAIGGRGVLADVSIAIQPGEVVGVIGANGAGKTTLLRAALGLQRLKAGAGWLHERPLHGLDPADRARLAGYLPQDRKEPPAEAQRIARAMLVRVGLGDLAERGVLDMSGGERARVLLARLLATRAPLLVADEPAAGLDPDAQLLVLHLLREEARRGAAVLVTLHDLTLAARFCDRLIALHAGRAVADGAPATVLAPQGLKAIFGLYGALVDTPHGPVAALRRPDETADL
jgi:iron complex transport system ATP-binding protein